MIILLPVYFIFYLKKKDLSIIFTSSFTWNQNISELGLKCRTADIHGNTVMNIDPFFQIVSMKIYH